MTWSVVWTLLPNGFDPATGRARLSLVASPRNAGPGTTLGASPLARWPTIVAGLGPLSVRVNPAPGLVPATVVSPAPEQALWDRLFPPTTPVDAYTPDAPFVSGQGALPAGGGAGAAAAGSLAGPDGARRLETSHPHGAAATALAGLYEQTLRTSPTQLLARDHPVAQMVAGISAWTAGAPGESGAAARAPAAGPEAAIAAGARAVRQAEVSALLDPGSLTAARIEQAAATLRRQGHAAAAAAAPLAPVLRRLRLRGAPPAPPAPGPDGAVRATALTGTGRPPGTPGTPSGPPSLLSDIRPVEQADFHQVVGLLLDHPTLALRLGLRVDLTIQLEAGQYSIRIAGAGGLPPEGPVAVPQPFCRVAADPHSGRFVMATEPLTVPEVVNGMLDLRSATTLTPGRSVVSDLDVVGLTEQLHVLSTALVAPPSGATAAAPSGAQAAPGGPPPVPQATPAAGLALPVRHDVGLTVSVVDRLTGAAGRSLARAAGFQRPAAGARAAGTSAAAVPDLFADDVTSGYRVDVSMDGGPFRSLMRRRVAYQIGGGGQASKAPLEAHDEGLVDPIVPVQQYDQDGNPHLLVGEELFGWEGWSLTAQKPGPKVVAETAGGPTVAPVEPGPAPGYPLTMKIEAEPGSLTRLRYGRSYRFRARAVDPAGNSIDPALCDPAYVTAAAVYRRHEIVPPPVLVPRRRFVAGESLLHLVVLSDGEGAVLGGPAERHVAPPKCAQALAETHGLFDEAFGPDTPARAAARKRMLDVARREAGSFLDPRVPNPSGGGDLVPAPGIAVTTNDPVKRPPVSRLPLPRGLALRDGEYVVHDTAGVACPYLPDPAASGAAFAGLPGASGPVTVDYGARPWPTALPFRLEVRAQTGGTAGAALAGDASGRRALVVNVLPATLARVQLSSTVAPAALDVMDPIDPGQRQDALNGKVPLFSPCQELTIVHAVRKPLAPAVLSLFMTERNAFGDYWPRKLGDARVRVHGMIQPHAASTGRVDVVAAWDEVVDRPGREVKTERRRETLASFGVRRGENVVGFGNAPSVFPLPGVQFPTAYQAIEQVLGDQKHRVVGYSVTAATAFREYFLGLADDDPRLAREGAAQTVHVLNARRPDPLAVHSLMPVFKWDRQVQAGRYASVRRTAGVRVYLRRPWHTTGADERLGVLAYDSVAAGEANVARNDPACRLVSHWGLDPLEGRPDQAQPHLTADDFPARKEVLGSMALLELGRSRAPAAYAVSVVGHEVRFDPARDLWYADVEIALPEQRFPFLRLGLVRFQPMSTQGSHVSRVALPDPVQLPPVRTMSAVIGGPNSRELRVTLSGPRLRSGAFSLEHHRRVLEPALEPRLDITERTAGTVFAAAADATPDGIDSSALLVAPVQAGPGGTPAIPPEYLKGRIVVRESQAGRDVLTGASQTRTVYLETFDRDLLPPNPTLSVSPGAVPTGGQVTVTWSGAVGATPKDWIGVYAPADPNKVYKMYQYTDGTAAGSLVFTMTLQPGTYVFRFLPANAYDSTAASAPVTVTSPPPPPTGISRAARTGQQAGRGLQGESTAVPGEL